MRGTVIGALQCGHCVSTPPSCGRASIWRLHSTHLNRIVFLRRVSRARAREYSRGVSWSLRAIQSVGSYEVMFSRSEGEVLICKIGRGAPGEPPSIIDRQQTANWSKQGRRSYTCNNYNNNQIYSRSCSFASLRKRSGFLRFGEDQSDHFRT